MNIKDENLVFFGCIVLTKKTINPINKPSHGPTRFKPTVKTPKLVDRDHFSYAQVQYTYATPHLILPRVILSSCPALRNTRGTFFIHTGIMSTWQTELMKFKPF